MARALRAQHLAFYEIIPILLSGCILDVLCWDSQFVLTLYVLQQINKGRSWHTGYRLSLCFSKAEVPTGRMSVSPEGKKCVLVLKISL